MQTRGKVRGLADDIVFGNSAADNDHSGGDPYASAQRFGQLQSRDRIDDRQGAPRRPLGIVLVRSGIAEIDQDPVAHISGDEAVETLHYLIDGMVIGSDQVP